MNKFPTIKLIEVKKCDFKDDLFIEGITAYDNVKHHFKIARKFLLEMVVNLFRYNLHIKSHGRNF